MSPFTKTIVSISPIFDPNFLSRSPRTLPTQFPGFSPDSDAGEIGRRHYREIADHLNEMQELGPEERFEEFIDFLKEKHSNRPAFLDELEKAGF